LAERKKLFRPPSFLIPPNSRELKFSPHGKPDPSSGELEDFPMFGKESGVRWDAIDGKIE
jgi:hypothetical protein